MFPNRRMQLLLGLAAALSLMGTGERAESATATLEVTASVVESCTVQGGTIPFGTVDPSAGSSTVTGGYNIQCSADSDVDLALDGGLYNGLGGNTRAMKRSGSEHYLNYKLYNGTTAQAELVPGTPVTKPVFVGANPIAVTGLIETPQSLPGGDYSDTVQITMTVH